MNNSLIKPKKFKPKEGYIPDYRIVNVFLINNEGECLLFKRPEGNVFFPEYYHLLAEKLQEKESFKEGVVRGVFEETSISIGLEDVSLIGDSEFVKWDGSTWEMKLFSALMYNNKVSLNDENSEYLWKNPFDIGDLKVVPQFKGLCKRYAKFLGVDKKGLKATKRAKEDFKKGRYEVLTSNKDIEEFLEDVK